MDVAVVLNVSVKESISDHAAILCELKILKQTKLHIEMIPVDL